MATIPYYIGETGTLGFPVSQYDGTPIATTGLGCRLTVYLTGADLVLTGTWQSGQIVPPGETVPITHPAIASFAVTPESMPLSARVYPCGLSINDGTGWRVIGTHFIDARRP